MRFDNLKHNYRYYIILLMILFIGFINRAVLVYSVDQHPDRYIQEDAIAYNRLAINLASGNGFSTDLSPPFVPENFRTPGYPAIVAFIYSILGYHPPAILWLQVLIDTLTILLTYILASKIASPQAGLISAGLLAFSPISITYSALLWSETAFTFVFLVSIIATVFMLTSLDVRWILISGLVTGIAVLIHPRVLYLPIVITLILVGVLAYKRIPLRKIITGAFVYLLIFNLVLLPWRLRNYELFGVPNVTSAGGINILHYGAALTESALTGEDQWSISRRYKDEVKKLSPRPLNEAESGELSFALGLKKISKFPLIYAKVHLTGMLKIFLPGTLQINTLITGQNTLDTAKIYGLFSSGFGIRQMDFFRNISTIPFFVWSYIVFDLIFLLFVYSFSIYALAKQGRSQPWLWFFVIILFYLAFIAGPAGAPRFRVVMMPFLCILASIGLLSIDNILNHLNRWLKPANLPANKSLGKPGEQHLQIMPSSLQTKSPKLPVDFHQDTRYNPHNHLHIHALSGRSRHRRR